MGNNKMEETEIKAVLNLDNFFNDIINFIDKPIMLGQSKWFFNEAIQIYLRNTNRCIHSKNVPVITVATIEVQPNYQNKGLASYLINYIHNHHQKEGTYLECVHEPILISWAIKYQWEIVNCIMNIEYNFIKYK